MPETRVALVILYDACLALCTTAMFLGNSECHETKQELEKQIR